MKDHACETYQTMQHPQRPYGLLGKTLKHSFSPQLHAAIGAALGTPYPYILFEKQSEELASFLQGDSWAGLNVTCLLYTSAENIAAGRAAALHDTTDAPRSGAVCVWA